MKSSRNAGRDQKIVAAVGLAAMLGAVGCSTSPVTAPAAASTANQYLGPRMNVPGNAVLTSFAVDRTAKTFVKNTYDEIQGDQQYIQTSGTLASLSQGVLGLSLTYACPSTSVCQTGGVTYAPPQTGSFAVELPGQALLSQIAGSVVIPAAPNAACPANSTPRTYQFVTIPGPYAVKPAAGLYSPATDTAYGVFSLTANGSAIGFSAIQQFAFPPAQAPLNPSTATVAGACAATTYGQTISVPAYATVTNAGSNSPSYTPAATIAIGPGGFLVEDNGVGTTLGGTTNANPYQNVLGAGLGAVGLAQPAAALTTSSVAGAHYLGYLYAGGAGAVGASSTLASFNLAGQTACATLPAASGTILYGGEFTNNDPSGHAAGNCDFAIDLGAQDGKNPGLYAGAKVYIAGSFPGNNGGKGTTYSFPAVAIAGQIAGQNAVFALGVDTTGAPNQGWGIYLLQTN